MARYYFDLHECGTMTTDPDGIELDDISAAVEVAISGARDVMCGEIKRGALCLSCYIEIHDAFRRPVQRVTFKEAVAISGL